VSTQSTKQIEQLTPLDAYQATAVLELLVVLLNGLVPVVLVLQIASYQDTRTASSSLTSYSMNAKPSRMRRSLMVPMPSVNLERRSPSVTP
jgi:hypothetical protein